MLLQSTPETLSHEFEHCKKIQQVSVTRVPLSKNAKELDTKTNHIQILYPTVK